MKLDPYGHLAAAGLSPELPTSFAFFGGGGGGAGVGAAGGGAAGNAGSWVGADQGAAGGGAAGNAGSWEGAGAAGGEATEDKNVQWDEKTGKYYYVTKAEKPEWIPCPAASWDSNLGKRVGLCPQAYKPVWDSGGFWYRKKDGTWSDEGCRNDGGKLGPDGHWVPQNSAKCPAKPKIPPNATLETKEELQDEADLVDQARLEEDEAEMQKAQAEADGTLPVHGLDEFGNPITDEDLGDQLKKALEADFPSTDHSFTATVQNILTQSGPEELGKSVSGLTRALDVLKSDVDSRLSQDRLASMTAEDVPDMVTPVASSLKEVIKEGTGLQARFRAISDAAYELASKDATDSALRIGDFQPVEVDQTGGLEVADEAADFDGQDATAEAGLPSWSGLLLAPPKTVLVR
eukprot:TRINITY_DN1897_c0_g1_i2.p1 TRINITY_DN1897_c0_g1~~TRINITY_DN1897_c0_g1_i2.p1  ORF type:complete len:404 (-),score=87.37 TRINITY_DN1897_c0_g1_i2:76-1287(-)